MPIKRVQAGNEDGGKRLDAVLRDALSGMPIERVRSLIAQGKVRIRGKAAKAQRRLWGGELIEIDLPDAKAVRAVEGPPVPVLYRDERLLIVDKPPGVVTEPDGGASSLVELVAAQQGGFDVGGEALPGVVHRLDRETSGCLLLGRTDEGVRRLERAFAEKRVEKRYLAIVLGQPPDHGSIETPYARSVEDPRRFTTRVPSARRAALSFRVVERFDAPAALVEVNLETGRTHQIRVQLSEAGFPVLADPLYGPAVARSHPAAVAIGRLALHAVRLELTPGAGEAAIHAEAPVPEDLQRGLEALR